MNIKNEMSLKIMAISQNESFARSAIGAFSLPLNPTIEEINDIKTAVSEAVTNSIVHAYPKEKGLRGTLPFTTINAKITGNTLQIEVVDEGIGIEDVETALQPFFTTKPEQERSGMGFTVMQTFMDSVKVSSFKGVGTRVIMSKRIGKK